MSSYRKPSNPSVSLSRRKQRKALYTCTGEARLKRISSPLSKELRKTYEIRRTIIHKDDVVTVTVGKFKGKSGKVAGINMDKMRITVEDCTAVKSTGGTVLVPIDPSNVVITELALSDDRKTYLENLAKKNAATREMIKTIRA